MILGDEAALTATARDDRKFSVVSVSENTATLKLRVTVNDVNMVNMDNVDLILTLSNGAT